MNLNGLLSLFNRIPAFRELADALPKGEPGRFAPLHMPLAVRAPLLAALQDALNRPMLVVTSRADYARNLFSQCRIWAKDPESVLRLPDPDALPYEKVAWGRDAVRGRLASLFALLEPGEPPPMVITSARALMQKTLPPGVFREHILGMRVGQRVRMQETVKAWVDAGYTNANVVEEAGQFSRRGGILDVFPPEQPRPLRIELFGDEIDSLRRFDPFTQLSEDRVDEFTLGPAREALPCFGPAAAELLEALPIVNCHPIAQMGYREDAQRLKNCEAFKGVELYMQFMYPEPASLLDYLPESGLLVVEEPYALSQLSVQLQEQAQELRASLEEQGELPPGWPDPYFGWGEIEGRVSRRADLILGQTDLPDPRAGRSESTLVEAFSAPKMFGGQLKPLIEEVAQRRAEDERVVLVSRQAPRINNLLAEQDVYATLSEEVEEAPPPRSVLLVQGDLSGGWRIEGVPKTRLSAPLNVLSDAEVFGFKKQPAPIRRKPRAIAPEAYFADIEPGDFVVHIEQGIGIFRGLVTMHVEGEGEREYLQVDYALGDKLYVPTHQADRLSRYTGLDDRPPSINRLGTADWQRVKQRAKRAVEEIAKELLEIYAAREVIEGHAFQEDTPWQQEVEASFPYVETQDQLEAIEQVKADMEKPKPMDRLICGDVGYGKTEVALRAAFKAVMDGVQVAILVPTTVLAQQHYETFRQRLSAYPINVEMLSRFRSGKEQKSIIKDMGAGSVDIIIGTHRLLQNDVRFKNLGLLVIDEEQRFGVTHKEKLKQLRKEVDVLTMTATPIPRTLHMALGGARDMSTIETPPEERFPIQTALVEYDENVIRSAVLREIDRGGQVYYVYNRVMGIEQMAQRLRRIVPGASIKVAHGQMRERDLERIMLSFAAGEFDVLVCTSIIESGLDIPNANTIIMHRADRFGLAQLYQLRGRVGRGANRAYAYLVLPKGFQPGETAQKRLEAIVEASELGAGFRIAMRDLEIRGAGELLGAKQHGHIAAVGFDLYTRLLSQAVRELRGESPQLLIGEDDRFADAFVEGVQINLPLPTYLPVDYVPDESLRLQLYRRLAGLVTEEQIADAAAELQDRFGKLPPQAQNLLYQLRLKLLAIEAGVDAIVTEEGQIVLRSENLEHIPRDALQRRIGPQARVARRQIWLPMHPDPKVWTGEIERILRLMIRTLQDPAL